MQLPRWTGWCMHKDRNDCVLTTSMLYFEDSLHAAGMKWTAVVFPATLRARDPRREPVVRLGEGVVVVAAGVVATMIVIAVATRSTSASLPCKFLHLKSELFDRSIDITLSLINMNHIQKNPEYRFL